MQTETDGVKERYRQLCLPALRFASAVQKCTDHSIPRNTHATNAATRFRLMILRPSSKNSLKVFYCPRAKSMNTFHKQTGLLSRNRSCSNRCKMSSND